MEVKLNVLEGVNKGREIPLPVSLFVIGRDSHCHLRPHSELVSKLHCAIGRNRAGDVVVRDLKSRNRTYINNRQVNRITQVNDGDILRVGPLRFRFRINNNVRPSDKDFQPLTEETVNWLLENSSNSPEPNSNETTVVNVPVQMFEDTDGDFPNDDSASWTNDESPSNTPNEKLSAGKYLHDYFDKKPEDKQ